MCSTKVINNRRTLDKWLNICGLSFQFHPCIRQGLPPPFRPSIFFPSIPCITLFQNSQCCIALIFVLCLTKLQHKACVDLWNRPWFPPSDRTDYCLRFSRHGVFLFRISFLYSIYFSNLSHFRHFLRSIPKQNFVHTSLSKLSLTFHSLASGKSENKEGRLEGNAPRWMLSGSSGSVALRVPKGNQRVEK